MKKPGTKLILLLGITTIAFSGLVGAEQATSSSNDWENELVIGRTVEQEPGGSKEVIFKSKKQTERNQ